MDSSYMLQVQLSSPELLEFYQEHSTYHPGDAGLDLFVPHRVVIPRNSRGFILNLGIRCQMLHRESTFVSYYLYPRSSMGAKTPLRLANSVGIIDAGYRGPICAILDNLSDEDVIVEKGERLVQICTRNLKPLSFQLVQELASSQRGSGGIGSTNSTSASTTSASTN